MAIVQNTYTGNGSTTLYSLSFPYLDETDVKVTLNGVATTSFVFVNASTIQFISAPANGVAIRIYRETDIDTQTATFFAGSAIRAQDLNDNITQTLYAVQESNFEADTATTTANTALTNSNTAISTANTASTNASNAVTTANTANANASAAVTTANTANTNASAAVSTANTASTNASAAVTTANTALSTANSATTTANNAVSTANSALSAANSAVSTANTASTNATAAVNTANTASSNASTAVTTANNALSTANTALSNSATAISTANSAIAAVASAVIYTPVANLTALAALTPANGDYFELTDSTGAESSALITGVTVGLVGAPGLTFRLRYDAPPGIFTFLGYFANDSETRYLKFSGGTLTGQLRGDDSASAATPGFAFDGDANTGVGRPGADELALITGGSARLTINSAGAVAIPGTLGVTGAITGSLTGAASSNVLKAGDTMTGALVHPLGAAATPSITFTGDPNTGIYSPGADQVAISTNGSGRLFVDASGNVGVGVSSPQHPVHIDGTSGSVQFRAGVTYTGTGLDIKATENSDVTIDVNDSTKTVARALVFSQAGSERMRLDSSGRLGLGTSSPAASSKLDVTGGDLVVSPNTAGKNTFTLTTNAADDGRLLIKSNTTTKVDIQANGTSYFNGGNVGIGTTSASGKLHVSSGASSALISANADDLIVENNGNCGITIATPNSGIGAIRFTDPQNDDSGAIFYNHNTEVLSFNTFSTERMRVDSSGRLLVGTSSDVSGEAAALIQSVYSTGALTSIGRDDTTVNNGDFIGGIDFHTKTGASSTWQRSARILCWADADQGSGDAPGRLTFSTCPDGSATPVERLRIGNNGTTFFGTNLGTNLASSEPVKIAGNCGDRGGLLTMRDDGIEGSNRDFIRFHNSSNTDIGAIEHNGSTSVAYLTSSDYRLKENVVPLTGAANRIKQIPVHRFNFIAEPNKTVDGFLAHEAQAIVPECVSGAKDEVDADGNPVYQGIDQSKLVPLLTAALQEALDEIESLKARVTALEP